MSAIVTVQQVTKAFGTREVLRGVSFAIHDRDRVGLVGLNGAGKSTLLRLIAAGSSDPNDVPDTGLITRKRELSIEYVSQEPKVDLALTVVETLRQGLRTHTAALDELNTIEATIATLAGSAQNAALERQAELHQRIDELGGWDRDHELRGLAASLQLPPMEAIIGNLSGWRATPRRARARTHRATRVTRARRTNQPSRRGNRRVARNAARGVSRRTTAGHARSVFSRSCGHAHHRNRSRRGVQLRRRLHAFLEQQSERLAEESEHERQRSSFVRRELDWIRRGPKARTTKQQARIDRFDAAVSAAPGQDDKRPGKMQLRLSSGGRLGKTILECKALAKSLGGKQLFENLSMIVKPGDRIGIVGKNGAGKTTLVRTLLGEITPDAGTVITGINTRPAYLDQGRAELDPNRTVMQEVAGDSEHVELEGGPVHVRTFLRMLLFDDRFGDTPVGILSGGERNRVQLAKMLRRGGNLLVLDEPTNDLDLMTLGVLEEALVEFAGCALIVSHDRWFLDRVATGILAFEGEGVVVFYEGDYSSYLAKRAARAKSGTSTSAGTITPAATNAPTTPSARAKKLTFKEREELNGMEAAIAAAEANVAAIESTLGDPQFYKERSAEAPALNAKLAAARAEVERLYARWQALETNLID